MQKKIRIGTRDSQLAVWQALKVQELLSGCGYPSELVYIKSEGDVNLTQPLYAMGVQGVFTRSLDIAMLHNQVDIAVHSMKDVPIQLAKGIMQAAVLPRASHKDILVYKGDKEFLSNTQSEAVIATCSVRRKAQWLHRYPRHVIADIRGNVNTRLRKVEENTWNGAIFAAAGLERINLRPENSVDLSWMLPAPAQGAIMVVCREDDSMLATACEKLNDFTTAICVAAERDFLATLLGGCSTPISALAEIDNGILKFKGNIVTTNGSEKVEVERTMPVTEAKNIGKDAAEEIMAEGGAAIIQTIRNAG